MLTFFSDPMDRDCRGVSRRDFLRIGALGLGSLGLPGLLAARARAASERRIAKDTSVVLLFLGGGASHIESFDPKMSAPAETRSTTGEVKTAIPGVTFGGTFPRLAAMADRMAVVRSFAHGVNEHERAIRHVMTGGNSIGASLGAICSRLRGGNHPVTGMPTFAHLTTEEVDPQFNTEKQRVINGDAPGSLGAGCAAFDPVGKGPFNRNLQLNLPANRFEDRRALQRSLDTFDRQMDGRGVMDGMDKFEQQACHMILGNTRAAFDLSKESNRLIQKYDTSRYIVGHNRKRRSSPLGHQMLLARRLCEAGCGFVTVQCVGWDHHGDGNNVGVKEGMELQGPPLDQAVSTFLEDVEQRGLSEKILLVITGDFGRTPKINRNGGRDHWNNLCTLALAGGGLKMGRVVGESASRADVPRSEPVRLEQLMATVFHVLFDPAALRLDVTVPRDLGALVADAQPIAELV